MAAKAAPARVCRLLLEHLAVGTAERAALVDLALGGVGRAVAVDALHLTILTEILVRNAEAPVAERAVGLELNQLLRMSISEKSSPLTSEMSTSSNAPVLA